MQPVWGPVSFASETMYRPSEKHTILLLISDALARSVFQDALERAGYLVLPASDLGVAVDRIKECTPDLLITRGYLSNMSGHEAAKQLRRRCPMLPVLIAGGMLDDDRLRYRESLEGFEVFPKPYAASELLLKVSETIALAPRTARQSKISNPPQPSAESSR
jgi:DNA-binding NtrC family response regulator